MKIWKWLLLGGCLATGAAWAYSPPFSMILSRTADNHGRGAVVIDQDVTFHSASGDEVVHETWTVLDENRMRLTFQGAGPLRTTVFGTLIYDSRNRVGNDNGRVRSHRLAESWMEPFFFFRSSKAMRSRLVQMNIAPSDSLRDRAPLKSDGPPDYTPEPYVQLTRQDGMVTWAIAKSFGSNDQPELWIEQDQFVVTKVRTDAQVSVEAEDYGKYDSGFYFPRLRTYRWGDKSVTAQVRSVRSITNPKTRDILNSASLKPMQLSGSDGFKEFYSRFR